MWAVVAVPLGFFAAHYALFALAGSTPAARAPRRVRARPRLAVVIPAYREGLVLIDNVEAILAQAKAPVVVAVVADRCGEEVVGALHELAARAARAASPIDRHTVVVHEVAFERSTKTLAVRYALARLPAHVEAVVLLDADNVAHPAFLERMTDHWRGAGTAVQGRRLEKNRSSSMAALEGWMERVNHVVYRAGRARLGLSAALVGSAALFDRATLSDALAEVDSVGGFDKGLEIALICRGVRITWAPDAVVFDEKVDDADAFVAQKRRWISAQWRHLARWATRAVAASWRLRSLDPLDKLLQWASPPRSLLLAALPLVAALAALTGSPGWAAAMAGSWLAVVAAIAVATWSARTPTALLRFLPSAWRIPAAMALATARFRGADREFIHTAHDRRADASTLAQRLSREEV